MSRNAVASRAAVRAAPARGAGWSRRMGEVVLALGITLGLLLALPLQADARPTPDGFADLAEKLLPAVVNISTTQEVDRPDGPGFQLPPGSPLEDFFDQFRQGPEGEGPPRKARSLGSGFILDAEEGIVVTNNHVIKGADEITVTLQDDTELEAEVVGTDPKTDLAVLSVGSGHDLTAAEFGDSDAARIGNWVVAIGNPMGFGGSVTAGIISARGRDINAGPYDNFIQTDAPINRGNSGGPLFNLEGEVIGINTAIISQTGGSIGIGFAIPSKQAERVIEQIREYGTTKRGWLGVNIQNVTDDIADSLNLEEATGALVANVYDDSPADSAGFKSGDVILSFDGEAVPSHRALPRMVANTEVGKTVAVEVWRNGQRKTLEVTLGELEKVDFASLDPEEGEADEPGSGGTAAVEALGLTLAPLDARTAERLDIDPSRSGVVVTEVAPDSDAADKALRPGDVVLEVNQNEVTAPADIAEAVRRAQEAGRKSVLLRVEREGSQRFVALRLGEG